MFVKARTHLLSNFIKNWSGEKKTTSIIRGIQTFSNTNQKNDVNIPTDLIDFEMKYSTLESNLILEKINTCTEDELMRYKITKGRIKKITDYRDKKGSFKNISEIFLLPGIDIDVLQQLCKSILNFDQSSQESQKFVFNSDSLIPQLDDNIRMTINTCTGIWMDGNQLSWAQIDTKGNLLQWDCQIIETDSTRKSLLTTVDSLLGILSGVAPSQAYIMENEPSTPFSRMNSKMFKLCIQRQQILTGIVTVLGTREPRPPESAYVQPFAFINNIYLMRSLTTARFFKLLIGNEAICAGNTVQRLFSNEFKMLMPLNASLPLAKYYKFRNDYEREHMNWSLLLASAFMNISILKNVTVKSRGNKSENKM